jgi:hypothetical protein
MNGIPMENWGLNYVKMSPGSYTLSFSDVSGFDTPMSVIVTNTPGGPPVSQSLSTPIVITDGVITQVEVNFIPLGNLLVQTTPAVPATVFVNGNPMDDWGFWADIEPGTYTISFQPFDGMLTPLPLVVTVVAGATTHVVGNYTTGLAAVVP